MQLSRSAFEIARRIPLGGQGLHHYLQTSPWTFSLWIVSNKKDSHPDGIGTRLMATTQGTQDRFGRWDYLGYTRELGARMRSDAVKALARAFDMHWGKAFTMRFALVVWNSD